MSATIMTLRDEAGNPVAPRTSANAVMTEGGISVEAALQQIGQGGGGGVAPEELAKKVSKSGDTMTGDLTLKGDPTADLHAATKQYVDNAVANGGGMVKLPDNITYFNDGGEDIKIADRTMVTIDKMSAEPMNGNPVLMAMMPVGYVFTWEPVEGSPTDLSTPEKVAAHYGFGTWEQIGQGRALFGAGNGYEAGTTVEAGLPNIEGKEASGRGSEMPCDGVFYNEKNSDSLQYMTYDNAGTTASYYLQKFDASRSNSIYGNSETVQPPAFIVYVWKRVK